MPARLSRSTYAGGRRPAPVRIVHVGPGAFSRAHVAWYTEMANQEVGAEWGIAAVCSRGDQPRTELEPQEGLYSLSELGPQARAITVVQSISSVASSASSALEELVASPEVTIVTLTITEVGYRPGSPVLARLAAAIAKRVEQRAGPLAVCSLDNLANNGAVLRQAILAAAQLVAPDQMESLQTDVTWPSSVVDRITPAPTQRDRQRAEAALGLIDLGAVATETFSEWVFEDFFPGGRPAWERAGARPTDDVVDYQKRKLRLLNAGHSALSYLGGPRSYATVAQAIADDDIRQVVEGLWSEALPALKPSITTNAYCQALLERWSNPSIEHQLGQIAADGAAKLTIRLAPTMLVQRQGGSMPFFCITVLAAFWRHLQGQSGLPVSVADQALAAECHESDERAARKLLVVVAAQLADDSELVAALVTRASELNR